MPPDVMTPVVDGVVLIAEGRREGLPWCVWCNAHAADTVGHAGCLRAMSSIVWMSCHGCLGGGIDRCGRSCGVCHGVGFVAVDDTVAANHAAVLGLVDGVNW